MTVQLLVAWIVPAIVLIGAIYVIAVDRVRNPDLTIPTPADRVNQYNKLLAENATTPGAEPKTALMLLEQSKISYERVAADRSSIETRATTLVGLAAAATGASAFLTGGKGIAFSPTIAAAAVLALVSLGCLLFIMRAKFNPQPNPASLVFPNTVWNEEMQFRICLSLAENYSQGLVRLLTDMRKDRVVLFIATGSLVAATSLVVANAAFPLSQPSGVTKCSVQYHGTKIEKVKCAQ